MTNPKEAFWRFLRAAHSFMRDILGISALCALIALALFASQRDASEARRVVSLCEDANDKTACYEREIPPLLDALSVPDVFSVVREVRARDPEYQFCHVLAHKIGERVVAEDPARWADAIPLNPSDGLCSNGFIHGVVGGRFRAEVLEPEAIQALVPEFSAACEPRPHWRPSDLDRAICYHGLGHLYIFITDANVRSALDVCADTTPDSMRRVCIEGVFMQLYQPLEPDDFEMLKRLPVALTRETVPDFCGGFPEPEYEGACLRERWPLYADEIRSGEGVEAFCAVQPNEEERLKCYEAATAIIGRMSLNAPESAARACDVLPAERRALCYISVSRAVLEENRDAPDSALALCARADPEIANACVRALAEQARFIFGENKAQRAALCARMEAPYRAACERG